MITRRTFLSFAGGILAQRAQGRGRRPTSSEFVFARLRYDSGDWDYNPKVAGNVLDSLVQYTASPSIPKRSSLPRIRRSCCPFRSSS